MSTAALGIAFIVVGFAAMFLMYHLWGYPFDKATKTSAAPRWAMNVHRGLGYVFALIYVVMMWKMVPRLWQYQVEFPARTTVHIVLGFTIGFLLIVKISILRFFRHFEEWMPYLGTAIMLGTVILLGLSLPFVFQERSLAKNAPGGDVLSPQSQTRVAQLLPSAGLPSDAPLAELAKSEALTSGRDVLLEKCVKCHDLRTILAKPRTPSGWWDTVSRMGEKPALFAPVSPREQYDVTAYLIAITPDLQKSTKKKREDAVARADAMSKAMADVVATPEATVPPAATAPAPTPAVTAPVPPTPAVTAPVPPPAPPKPKPAIDLAKAKTTYMKVCSQCHELTDVDGKPPSSATDAMALVQRMVKDNDAKLSADQIKQVTAYLTAHFVDKSL
jgi:mono/diheme cytochrome c family protein